MFLQNLRAKVGARLNGDSEGGFTLIELLVVMLILGILAAIALPAFFNQKDKAGDAKAKEYAHSAQVALETFYTDNGTYDGANAEEGTPAVKNAPLVKIEPTLSSAPGLTVTGPDGTGDPTATGYRIKVNGSGAQWFAVVNTGGVLTYPCSVEGKGGCPSGGWGG
jgi:type IV pilus assembly protein PilA